MKQKAKDQNGKKKRNFPKYTTQTLKEIRKAMWDYFENEGNETKPELILQTAETYFGKLAAKISNTRTSGEDVVTIKPSYLRNLFFYASDPHFKRLSKNDQDNVGIPKNPKFIGAIKLFFELYFHKERMPEMSSIEWVTMGDWQPRLQKHNVQGSDHKEVMLGGRMLKQITCRVIANSTYYRFGFKLLYPTSDLVGEGLIKSRNPDVLIHTGQCSQKDFSKKELFVSLYVGLEKIDAADKFTKCIPSSNGFDCKLYIDTAMNLRFTINQEEITTFTISRFVLSRVFMFAWADHDEFNIEVKDILVEVQ